MSGEHIEWSDEQIDFAQKMMRNWMDERFMLDYPENTEPMDDGTPQPHPDDLVLALRYLIHARELAKSVRNLMETTGQPCRSCGALIGHNPWCSFRLIAKHLAALDALPETQP